MKKVVAERMNLVQPPAPKQMLLRRGVVAQEAMWAVAPSPRQVDWVYWRRKVSHQEMSEQGYLRKSAVVCLGPKGHGCLVMTFSGFPDHRSPPRRNADSA